MTSPRPQAATSPAAQLAAFDPLRCARAAAAKYLAHHPAFGHQKDELLSDAAYGVALALRAWDPARGATLLGYARQRAYGEVVEGIRRRAHLPRSRWVPGTRLEELPAHERPPTSLEVALAAGRDKPGPCRELDAADARAMLQPLLDVLTANERALVTTIDLADVRAKDVAAARGVTESAISHSRAGAIRKMRAALEQAA